MHRFLLHNLLIEMFIVIELWLCLFPGFEGIHLELKLGHSGYGVTEIDIHFYCLSILDCAMEFN